MKILSPSEADKWEHGLQLSEAFVSPSMKSQPRIDYPKIASKQLWFCRTVVAASQPWSKCLLRVTGFGIWQSSENMHLYYKLRQSYGDLRLIEDARDHLFLDYEVPDLVSFLQIVVSFGWDARLLPDSGSVIYLFSHDEWLECRATERQGLTRAEDLLGQLREP